jgi:hypothetical protein
MKRQFLGFALMAFLISACGNEAKQETAVKKDSSAQVVGEATAGLPAGEAGDTDTASTVVVPEEGIALRFNLPKGKSYGYAVNMDMEQNMGEQKMSTGMNMNYEMKVIEDDGNVKTISTTYKRIAMNMGMGGQKMEFSSDNPAPSEPGNPMAMMGNMFAAMKGKSFIIKVNPQGEITKVEGFDKIGEAMANEMKMDEAKKKQVIEGFKNQFNENAVKESFGQSFDIFPDKKVKVGDSWQKKTTSGVGKTKMTTNTTYTVKGIKGNTMELASASKMDLNGQSADMKGTLFVDINTGMVKNGTIKQSMGGERKMMNTITIKASPLSP